MTHDAEKNPRDFDRVFAERERQDAAGASGEAAAAASDALDATCMYQDSETVKKDRDVAFALAALEANSLTERQLVGAVKDWTIHGDAPLSAHLIDKRLITIELRDELEK